MDDDDDGDERERIGKNRKDQTEDNSCTSENTKPAPAAIRNEDAGNSFKNKRSCKTYLIDWRSSFSLFLWC